MNGETQRMWRAIHWLPTGFLAASFVITICSISGAETGFLVEQAYDPTLAQALNNLHHEHADCVAYYLIAKEALLKADQKASAERMQSVAENLVETMNMMHRPETTLARVELALKERKKQIHHNLSNMSILISEYADLCETTTSNLEERLDYWLTQ